jgi:hypothetical protein
MKIEKKVSMKRVSVIVSLLVVFGFCLVNPVSSGQNPILDRAADPVSGVRSASWTIMVYLDGDNNLEGAGIDDFLEMAAIGSTSDVNIVVQFDRIDGHDASYDDWTTTKRFHVTPWLEPYAANALMDLGELNMGDPATLVDFVNWAKTDYPASNYALILWDHGGGWRKSKEELWKERKQGKKEELIFKAVCWDDTNGGDCLYMAEVKSALSSSGGAHLIGFDACLMGMVEVAYEIKDYGQVMVGSEEVEPGPGWPYHTIMSDLTGNPSWTPSQLGSAIVDRYYESYGNDYTQSAIDLSRMNTLANTISTFAQTMITYWDSDETAVRNAAQDVMAEIANAVINEKHGSAWPGAYGLAIYFPENLFSFDTDYNGTIIDFPNDTQWEEFLQEFYSSMGGSWIYEARIASQEFEYPEHVDLYHFCERLNMVPGDYYTESQLSHQYVGSGTAQGFQEDDDYITYSLPFDFPYFGETIPAGTDIYISSNGYVDFSASSNHWDCINTTSKLAANKRIAPCWADLRTDGTAQPGEDVYITENVDNLVIRWTAETFGDAEPVNVELVLFQDGKIQFNYNGGNADISPWGTPPTIGISRGDGLNYYLSVYNGQTTLTNSDSDLFTPIPITLTLTSPNGGENWVLGSTETITWTSSGITGDVKLVLYQNGSKKGCIAMNIPITQGSYTWTAGSHSGGMVLPGTGYVVRVKSIADKTYFDDSGSFIISGLVLTSPNGGENWALDSTETITWESSGLTGDVKLVLYQNGTKKGCIAMNIPITQGSYTWTVGSHSGGTALPGEGYVIRVKSIADKTIYDDSDESFAIKGLVLTSPNGGENWPLGSTQSVTWVSYGLTGNVKLVLYQNGSKKGCIAMNIPITQGSYTWTVGDYIGGPASPDTGYVIRVKSIADKTYFDDSGSFTISDS